MTADSKLTAAADLIKALDEALSNANASVLDAACEAEEARRNARTAEAIIRQYSTPHYNNGSNDNDVIQFSFSNNYREQHKNTVATAAVAPRNHSEQTSNNSNGSITRNGDTAATNGHGNSTGQISATIAISNAPYVNTRSTQQYTNGDMHTKTISPSSQDRMAQADAEDVLSLSLELERTRQALERERTAHDETRAALTQAQAKNAHLELHSDKLRDELVTRGEQAEREKESIRQELKQARERIKFAEDDAQVALDLAKVNAESREQLEGWLQRALNEIQVLKEHIDSQQTMAPSSGNSQTSSTQKRSVRFAEKLVQDSPLKSVPPPPPPPPVPVMSNNQLNSTHFVPPPPPPPLPPIPQISIDNSANPSPLPPISPPSNDMHLVARPSRGMVAFGRNLLQRSQDSNGSRADSTDNSTTTSATSTQYTIHRSIESTSDRRRRLRNRLQSIEAATSGASHISPRYGMSSPTSSAMVLRSSPMSSPVDITELCHKAAQIIKASCKRLKLQEPAVGAKNGSPSKFFINDDSSHIVSLVQRYCTSVESNIERKANEIVELESLCSLWESKS